MSESSKSRPDEYDPITDYHHLKFQNRCLRGSGDDFQQLFEDIMVRARPGEFERVRPYGKFGDRKCDGLIQAEGTIFQVYSPDELKQSEVQKKIDKDLDGAVAHWGDALKTWLFVYNVRRGVPPDILGTLQEKQKQYPNIRIEHLSNDDLWEITRGLSVEQRNEILGLPPSSTAKIKQTPALLTNSQEHEINWQEICRGMLPIELDANPLISGDGVTLGIEDIVPLDLVERKERPKPTRDPSPENSQQALEDQEIPLPYNQFFNRVLTQCRSLNQKGKGVAIIGEPGAGKTTLLCAIADWIMKQGELPIFVSLEDLEAGLEPYLLETWLRNAIRKRKAPEQLQDDLIQQCNAGRVWLLLDGVDEMVQSNQSLSTLAKEFRGWVGDARIVLTCRVNVWEANKNELRSKFEVYRSRGFREEEQLIFIQNFFKKAKQRETGSKLIDKLKNAPLRLKDLIKNPLWITLLCRTWKQQPGELPATKAELYQRFTKTFYDWKDKLYIPEEKRLLLERALGELAKNAIDREDFRFRLRETFIRQELDKFDSSLFGIACELGWINKLGSAVENPDEPVYAFLHPTFQEYFAALAIDNWHYFLNHISQNPNKGTYRIFKPQWKEVVLLWFGQREDLNLQKEDLINSLINFQDEYSNFYSYQAYFLAAASTAEFNCSRVNEIIEQVVKWSFHTSEAETHGWQDFPLKEQAKNLLSETNTIKTVKILTNLIEFNPLGSFLQSNGFSLKQALLNYQKFSKRLLDDKLKNSQNLSLELIDRYKPMLDVLNLIVKHDVICCKIIEILSQLDSQNPIIFETAEKILKNDLYKLPVEDLQQIRFLVAKTLGNLYPGNPITTQTLLELLVSMNNFYSRNKDLLLAVKILLEKVGKDNPNVINCLLQLLYSERNIEIYREAAEILGEVASDSLKTIESLIGLIQLCQDADKKLILNQCLGRLSPNHPEYIRSVVDTLSSLDPRRCYAIIDQITRTNQSVNLEICSALVKFITDVQRHLFLLYSNLEERETINCQNDNSNEILEESCAFAIDLITENLTNEIIDVSLLENLLDTIEHDWYLIIIAKSLWRISPAHEKAEEIFDRFLSKGSTARGDAVWNLISVSPNNPKAVSTLVELLRDEHDSNVIELFNTIDFSKQENPDIILNLRELLDVQDESVRSIAAQTLVRIDPNEPKVIHALVSLLNSPQEYSAALHDLEWCLSKLDNIDSETIIELIENSINILRFDDDKYYLETAGDLIIKACPNTLLFDVVRKLKICLTKSAFASEPVRYWGCYRVIWHCAQNMSYPNFHKAWQYL